MKNKITYLKLLEMIRDGKQPKEVIFDDFVWVWNDEFGYIFDDEFIEDKLLETVPSNLTHFELVTEKCITILVK